MRPRLGEGRRGGRGQYGPGVAGEDKVSGGSRESEAVYIRPKGHATTIERTRNCLSKLHCHCIATVFLFSPTLSLPGKSRRKTNKANKLTVHVLVLGH